MASPCSGGGVGSPSSSAASDHQHQGVMAVAAAEDQRKRKRMESNRESARRSRMKKQQHLDELVRQVEELRKENEGIMKNLSVTNQMYVSMESQNAVLRTQMAELTNRLDSLNEIINFINNSNLSSSTSSSNNNSDNYYYPLFDETEIGASDCGFFNPWINQPIMASGGNNTMY